MQDSADMKPEDARILGQTQAEILALNDRCPDEDHKKLMRTTILTSTNLLLYRLREYYADHFDGHGP